MLGFKWYTLLIMTLSIAVMAYFGFLVINRATAMNPEYSCIISDLASDKELYIEDDCNTQEAPCSTFKIALSLMGFDAGILKNEHEPEWPYKNEYAAPLEIWRQSHRPQTWMQHSCVWYSRVITSMLGMEKFRHYVDAFDYGNKDISGNHGKHDELTHSWLCSSLKISPRQQIAFIKKLLLKQLPVSNYANEQTQKLLFLDNLADGSKLYGKMGGGMFDCSTKSFGWFVGWFTKEKRTSVFACLVESNDSNEVVNGKVAKEHALKLLRS